MPIQVLLADDHAIVRQSLRGFLEREGFRIVAEAADGREAVRLAETLRPDVAVLDLTMPVLNGIDAAREIGRMSHRTKTVVLTMHTDDQFVIEALEAGIRGYVVKTQMAADLVHAIREVARGETYLSPSIADAVVDAVLTKADRSPNPLTPRERQVLQLVAEGKTTKEIAHMLDMSVKTAESHRVHIMEKLDIHQTAGLVRYAIRRGLIQA
jgi:two-component system, NarL family, response regulator NreC